MTRRLIDRISCVDDEGNDYEVHIYQKFSTFKPLNGPPREVPGVKDAVLANGDPVNFRGEDTFQVLFTDKEIRRVSPT